jgi:hypothetical protein
VASAHAAGCAVVAVPSLRTIEAREGVLVRDTLAGLTAVELLEQAALLR